MSYSNIFFGYEDSHKRPSKIKDYFFFYYKTMPSYIWSSYGPIEKSSPPRSRQIESFWLLTVFLFVLEWWSYESFVHQSISRKFMLQETITIHEGLENVDLKIMGNVYLYIWFWWTSNSVYQDIKISSVVFYDILQHSSSSSSSPSSYSSSLQHSSCSSFDIHHFQILVLAYTDRNTKGELKQRHRKRNTSTTLVIVIETYLYVVMGRMKMQRAISVIQLSSISSFISWLCTVSTQKS